MTSRPAVTHVSFSPLGGAGAVAVRLAAAQQRLGWQADLAARVDRPFPDWAGRHPLIAAAAMADYFLVRRNRQAAFVSLFRRQHDARAARRLGGHEGVLHLHWLPGFLWPPSFFLQPNRARRLVWSIQDLWPMTGGCHYANGCDGFTSTCEACPQVRRPFERRVAAALREKQAGLKDRHDILAVAPSEWARSMVTVSAVMRHLPTAVVPNPVDTRTFCPADRASLRAKWSMDPSAFVVGLGAADLRDERKRIPETLGVVCDWMRGPHPARSPQALVFGAGGAMPGMPPSVRFLGPSKDAAALAEWYNLMDVYVTLSRFETFGNTIAEAAACGTPTVCITGSGMAEVVVADATGLHLRTPDDLPAALTALKDEPSRLSRMGVAARQHAVCRFDDEVVARQFIGMYNDR